MQKRSHRRLRAGLCGGLLLLAVCCVGGEHLASAQSAPRVGARVSADSVKVGGRFTLTLVAEHAADVTAVFPTADAGAALFGDLHVVRRGAVQSRQLSAARQVDSVAYEVTTFALDSVRVPVLPIRLAAEGDTAVAGTAPRVVPVVSIVGPDAEGLRAPALLAAFPRSPWWWGVVVLAGAVLLVGGGYAWWYWQDSEDDEAIGGDERTGPYETASMRLQRLEQRNPTGRDACTAFYVDLTRTLRVYLAHRVGIRALEQTTPDVLAALRRRAEVDEQVVRRLQPVLEQADLVKFADAQPPPEESQSVLQDAQGVLDALEATQRRAEAGASTEKSTPA